MLTLVVVSQHYRRKCLWMWIIHSAAVNLAGSEKMAVRWTNEMGAKLLRLWNDVKRSNEKTMTTDKKRRLIVLDRLQKFAAEKKSF